MFRYRLIPVCVLLPVCLANCLWDTATEPGEPLNLEETEALYLGMQRLVRDTAPEFVSMTPDGGVFACPGGGQVQIASEGGEPATADGIIRTVTVVSFDPTACGLSNKGYEFTVDGNPSVLTTVDVGIVVSTLELLVDGSTTGGVDWRLDDRWGTCMIDLTLAADVIPGSNDMYQATLSGTMCGLAVEFEADRYTVLSSGPPR